MSMRARARRRRLEIVGWLLFVLSALLFLSAAVRSADASGIAASALFLIACFVFLAAHRQPEPDHDCAPS